MSHLSPDLWPVGDLPKLLGLVLPAQNHTRSNENVKSHLATAGVAAPVSVCFTTAAATRFTIGTYSNL